MEIAKILFTILNIALLVTFVGSALWSGATIRIGKVLYWEMNGVADHFQARRLNVEERKSYD